MAYLIHLDTYSTKRSLHYYLPELQSSIKIKYLPSDSAIKSHYIPKMDQISLPTPEIDG